MSERTDETGDILRETQAELDRLRTEKADLVAQNVRLIEEVARANRIWVELTHQMSELCDQIEIEKIRVENLMGELENKAAEKIELNRRYTAAVDALEIDLQNEKNENVRLHKKYVKSVVELLDLLEENGICHHWTDGEFG